MKTKLVTVLAALLVAVPLMAQEATIVRYVDKEAKRKPMHTVAPVYPHVARRDRIEGDVKVCYEVDRKGRPFRVAVRESTHRVFESPAREAVRASTYVPLKEDEENVLMKTCRTFRFRLQPIETDEPAEGKSGT